MGGTAKRTYVCLCVGVGAIHAGLSIHVPRTSQLATNVELVYVLLHQQETIASLRAHPRLGPLADNLYTGVCCALLSCPGHRHNYGELSVATGTAWRGAPDGCG